MFEPLHIAIDGPVGAGKSTVARLLANRLNITYVDTGAMYRCVALYCQQENIPWENESQVSAAANNLSISLKPPGEKNDGRSVTVLMEGKDVSHEIRTPEIGEGASIVSQYVQVRTVLVRKQQRIAAQQSVVMEGRDIGTKVLPTAQLKIFMIADLSVRVERAVVLRKKTGVGSLDKKQIQKEILKRDQREMTRKNSPMKPAKKAWMLDTSYLEIEDVLDSIVERLDSLGLLSVV